MAKGGPDGVLSEERRSRMRELWGGTPDGVVAFDADLKVLWANDAIGELLGYELEEWQGRQPFDAVHPDDLPRAYAAFEGLAAHAGPRSPNTFRVLRPDGVSTLVQLWGDNRLEDSDVSCLALHIVPLDEHRRAEALVVEEYGILERIALGQSAEETLHELALLVERYGPDVHCAISLIEDGALHVVTAPNIDDGLVAALERTPISTTELNAGRAIDRLDTSTSPDLLSDPNWQEVVPQVESSGYRACWTIAIISSRDDGTATRAGLGVGAHRSGAAHGVLDVFRAAPGEPEPDDWRLPFLAARLAAIVLERRRFVATLQHQATHDPLTGLRNRRGLAEWLQDAGWDAATPEGPAPEATVLFCDVDRFKVMNDRHGHEFGDHMLQEIAARLLQHAAAGAREMVVARLGGDEFLLSSLAPQDDREALAWAELVRELFSAPMTVDGLECVARVSIGVARGSIEPRSIDDLIRSADTAVYEAKAEGRDRCIVFDDDLRDEHRQRVETERELLDAIEQGHLQVHLQPVIEVATGRITGVEALARWNHPRRGLLLPGAFIGVAEEAGLVTTLDRWVAASALAQAAEIGSGREEDLDVWVNLSAMDLAHDGLVTELLALSHARPGLRLGVELTESALAADPNGAIEVLTALREGGLGVAIDDFGTGFSSLAALRSYPFTHVKIDRQFVVGMVEDPRDAAIVSSIITMARAFDMTTVAEGVETPEQLAALTDAGIDTVQGFLLSRPLPLEELFERFGQTLEEPILFL